jgi:aquaporin Z
MTLGDSTRRVLAECIGTFALVFAGTGAIVIHHASGGAVTHLGIAITFGLVVFVLIAALGDISGAHLNPAVTVSLWRAGRTEGRTVGPYLLAQAVGAVLASLVLQWLFPAELSLGATRPAGSAAQTWCLEFLLTAFLVWVILSVTDADREPVPYAAAAIGAVVGLEALFAGPISGASMNPARSLGPALVSGRLDVLWIYLSAPVLGGLAAVFTCRLLRPGRCCVGAC